MGKKEGKLPGEYKLEQQEHKNRQLIYDAARRAQLGDEGVYVTCRDVNNRKVRCLLAAIAIEEADIHHYAYLAGRGALIHYNGSIVMMELSGKEGRVYNVPGYVDDPIVSLRNSGRSMDSRAFLRKAITIVKDFWYLE